MVNLINILDGISILLILIIIFFAYEKFLKNKKFFEKGRAIRTKKQALEKLKKLKKRRERLISINKETQKKYLKREIDENTYNALLQQNAKEIIEVEAELGELEEITKNAEQK